MLQSSIVTDRQPPAATPLADCPSPRPLSQAVDQAVKLVEERKANPLARPVDSREAARGRVEFVKVRALSHQQLPFSTGLPPAF